ncbi:hypothetical protein PV325_005637 [Microctonus aethiopoides]|nr:hypothetical protein PV325_005637 [Microctonus aethiopoides]
MGPQKNKSTRPLKAIACLRHNPRMIDSVLHTVYYKIYDLVSRRPQRRRRIYPGNSTKALYLQCHSNKSLRRRRRCGCLDPEASVKELRLYTTNTDTIAAVTVLQATTNTTNVGYYNSPLLLLSRRRS